MGGLVGMIGAWWWVHWDGYSEMVTMRWVQSVSWIKQWLRRGEICLGRPASGCCTEEYPSSTEQLLRVYLSAFHLEGLDCQLKVQASGNQILHGRVASCSSILACLLLLLPVFHLAGGQTLFVEPAPVACWKPFPCNTSSHFLEIHPLPPLCSGILSHLFPLSASLVCLSYLLLRRKGCAQSVDKLADGKQLAFDGKAPLFTSLPSVCPSLPQLQWQPVQCILRLWHSSQPGQ